MERISMVHQTDRNDGRRVRESRFVSVIQFLIGLICAWNLTACATSRPSDDELKWLRETSETSLEDASDLSSAEVSDLASENLVIRPGNFITLASLEDSTLNGRFRVRLDGVVELPYGKRMKVTGLSAAAFQSKVRDLYKVYFKNGEVGIAARISDREILVDVRGLVAKPGRYSIERDTSLDELVGKAGGFSAVDGRPGFASIRSGSTIRYYNLNAYYNGGAGGDWPRWTGGEVITFLSDVGPRVAKSTAPTVRVLGEVRSPGEIAFVPGADIYHYFSIAGGPTVYSDQDEVELVRGEDHERRSVRFSMKDFSEYVKLKRGDVIIVHSNQPSTFERRVQLTSGVATVVSTLVLILVTIF